MSDYKKLEEFDHIVLLKATNIKINELSQDIKNVIADFESKFKRYRMQKEESQLKVLDSYSKVIAQHIVDYFVEDEEQTPSATIIEQVADVKNAIEEKDEKKEIALIVDAHTDPNKAQSTPMAPPAPPVAPPVVTPPTHPTPVNPPIPSPAPVYADSDDVVLAKLMEEGKTEVTKKELVAAGFKTGMFSKLTYNGATTKFFILKKIKEDVYSLSKR